MRDCRLKDSDNSPMPIQLGGSFFETKGCSSKIKFIFFNENLDSWRLSATSITNPTLIEFRKGTRTRCPVFKATLASFGK